VPAPEQAASEESVRIPMADGVELAATLYLPGTAEPQPCLLEALPYRKDDLTSSYAEGYRSLRDEHSYAVCRVDLRGTGSSAGDATDEYPIVERTDLCTVIAWLAEQEWCDGNVGMFGTSYSGFNSLQIAAERPPALKAIVAIYSSDDRWTDDVHWRGNALRLVDLVDYCHYMTPMCVLPPVPAEWPAKDGQTWRQEWMRRWETNEPWLLTWLRENRDGPYWQAGSLRHASDGQSGYDRIQCPTMIVAGWADGYRNNSFRTVEALGAAGTPWRLLAGPWAHADPATAIPGPRIDLDREMVAWWDRWLRDTAADEWTDRADVFVRTSTVPEADLELHEGHWVSGPWPPADAGVVTYELDGPRSLAVDPDTGVSAWIDCAGHLPWGLSGDQREDDARSLTWEWDGQPTVVGQPLVRLRVSGSAPAASLSVKLCDVFADGTSALITRGTLDLAFRDSSSPVPLVPGEQYDVELLLDACAYRPDPGHRLRLSVAGADWPNTIAPPAPVTLTVHGGEVELPLWPPSDPTLPGVEPPSFAPGAESSTEDPTDVTWSVTRDVLRRTTTCTVRSVASYDVPHEGTALEDYRGEVGVDRRSFAQWATGETTYRLIWPHVEGPHVERPHVERPHVETQGVDVRVVSTLRVDIGPDGYDVVIESDAYDDEDQVGHREWREHMPR
jgi:predicted acyl esterase